jgi:peptidoglycan/LPS O-acetylase OafA/YrhL
MEATADRRRSSHSLYLVHAPVVLVAWVFLIGPLDVPSGAKLATMIGMVPGVVAVGYRFLVAVERPFLEHRSWRDLRAVWARRRPGISPVPSWCDTG